MDEKIYEEISRASEKKKNSRAPDTQVNIWRIIMKSRITKITTAAAIILVAMVGLYRHTGSFHGTTAAFATSDVIAAMKQVQWLHATQQMIDTHNVPDDKIEYWNGRESWQSIDPYRTISIGQSGDITFTELNSKKVYDPKNNTITITFSHSSEIDPPANMQEAWLNGILSLEKEGAKVEYSDSVYEDRPAKIIKVDYTKESGWHEEITIIADAETHLARKYTVYQKTAEGVRGTILMFIDYPSTGPKDIYEAGAPRDAEVKVINNPNEEK
jgi:hypothetical protein